MSWFFWFLILLIFFAFTHLMKVAFNAKTYLFLISMISSKKAAKILDKFKGTTFWIFVSKLGIFLGFGFFGILFWYWHSLLNSKKKPIWKIVFYSLIVLIVGLSIGSFGLIKSTWYFYALNVFVFFLFGFAGFGILLLGYQAALIIKGYILGRVSCPGVAPVIPGVTIPGTDFKIPFFEGWLALIMIMIVHEIAHGILSRKIGVNVKSFGVLLLGVFPIGAFTEPDEKDLQKSSSRNQLLVYSSGPVFNLVFALIVFLISLAWIGVFGGYVIANQTQSIDGLYLVDVSQYSGICNLGVSSQNVTMLDPLFSQLDTNKELFFKAYTVRIISLDGNLINNRTDFTIKQTEIINTNKQSVELVLFIQDVNKVLGGIYHTVDLKVNSDGSFGVKSIEKEKDNYDFPFWYLVMIFILTTLQWTYLLSFMVGLFNFLPLKPLDGGAMLPLIVNEFLPHYWHRGKRERFIKIVAWTIIILFLTLILINALPLFI